MNAKRLILIVVVVYFLVSCSARCFNGGACSSSQCLCPDGYYGNYCEIRKLPNFWGFFFLVKNELAHQIGDIIVKV